MREAGSGTHYNFVLRNENNGRYVQDVVLSFPSTSTIVKQTLAAPQLVGWAYRTTRDTIIGLAGLLESGELDVMDFIETFADEADAETWLKENKLRPDDMRDERAEEGTREHGTLEALAKLDYDDAMSKAEKLVQSDNGRERAIADWWIVNGPEVVAAEKVLPCPRFGFCGKVDLIWYTEDRTKRVTDLKTRRVGLGVYDSDMYQVDGYYTAYNLSGPEVPATERSVLLAYEDGTWKEELVTLPEGAFLRLKEVYDLNQALKRRSK